MLEKNMVYNVDCIEGMKLLDDNSIDMVLTDPPFGVSYGDKSTEFEKMGKARQKQVDRDKHYIEFNVDYNEFSKQLYRIMKYNTHCYIFCSDKQIHKWIISMNNVGFSNYQTLVWAKNRRSFDLSAGHYFLESKEHILFFHKGFRLLERKRVNPKLFGSVLRFKNQQKNNFHPCERPFDLLYFLIELSSNEGDLILDCFSGSGNHLIASKHKNRSFIGFELSPYYYEIIKKRLKIADSKLILDNALEIKEKQEDWLQL